MARTIEFPRRPVRSDVQQGDRERQILFAGRASDIERAAESLRSHGLEFSPSSASNRDEAIAAINQGGWSAIIADYGLHIAAPSGVPLILLIDEDDEQEAIEALRSGAADYVMKDHLGRLGPIVRRVIEAAEGRGQTAFAIGRVAANVAHEFNNILMGIAPFVDVARRASASPQKIESALEQIAGAIKRGRRITEDIHRYTQPSEPTRAPVDVAALLRGVENETRAMLGPAHRLTIDCEPLWMDADAHQLHQVFVSLVLHARDTMISGGEIALTARRDARRVHFIVSDTGRGYSEEALRHAFDPLSAPKRCALGFGFAAAQQVLLRHNGEMSIESTMGQGTTVHLYVPTATRRHILLVDDDLLVSEGISLLLEAEGYDVTQATTGAEAIARVQTSRPDAIVLDVGLPDMDGKEVFTAIVTSHPTLPVVFSTGHAAGGDFDELLARTNVQCLMKPYESASLMAALAKLLT